MAGKPKGRDAKLTPEARKAVCDGLAAGVPRKYAALRAGVAERTLRRWLARGKAGRRGDAEYAAFLSAVKKAEADAVAARVARIGRAGQGGQVVERTTKTVTVERKGGETVTTTSTTEKYAPGQWTADAWLLERCHPEEFAGNRLELQLRRELASQQNVGASGVNPVSIEIPPKESPPVGEQHHADGDGI